MCDATTMQNMQKQWSQDFPDFDATFKSWEKSVHSAHLKYHPEEYMAAWEEFMNKIKLGNKH